MSNVLIQILVGVITKIIENWLKGVEKAKKTVRKTKEAVKEVINPTVPEPMAPRPKVEPIKPNPELQEIIEKNTVPKKPKQKRKPGQQVHKSLIDGEETFTDEKEK